MAVGAKMALAAFGVLASVMATGVSKASAETRTLHLYNTHTHERVAITFKRNGRYDADGLRKLNRFLRDWRRNESIKMDPALFDLIWEVYQRTGTSKDIHVVSGYRSPATNNMLRNRSRGVAKFSQHTLGKAMDFFIPGMDSYKLRVIGMRQQIGGVGYYPRSASRFVHMDTGRVRHWPRMTRSQLVKVFPRGETLHVPSDGKPLPGYDKALARAKTGQRQRTVVASLTNPTVSRSTRPSRYSNDSDDVMLRQRGSGKGFLSAIFGGGADEEEDNGTDVEATPTPPAPIQVAKTAVPGVKSAETEEPAAEAAPAAPTEAAPAAIVAEGPAPTPRSKPMSLLAQNTPEQTTPEAEAQPEATVVALLPRAKPRLATTQVAALETASRQNALPEDKPTVETDAAAVMAYGAAVPDSKPASVLDATRQFAAIDGSSTAAIPAPRHRPNQPRMAALGTSAVGVDDVSGKALGAGKSDPVAPIANIRNRLRNRLFIDAQTTQTMSFANLSHPDQHSLTALLSKPSRTLANDFSGDMEAVPEPQYFTGPAIGSLTVVRLN